MFGLENFELEPEDSAKGIISVIENATEKESGRFWNYEGKELPW